MDFIDNGPLKVKESENRRCNLLQSWQIEWAEVCAAADFWPMDAEYEVKGKEKKRELGRFTCQDSCEEDH